jgi:hypothetical protein
MCSNSTKLDDSVVKELFYDDDEEDAGAAKEHYINSGNNKKILAVLAVGLQKENGAPLFDFDSPPWNSQKKGELKPARSDLQSEIERRAKEKQLSPSPRPKNWNIEQCHKWLCSNPIDEEKDVKFIKLGVARLEALLLSPQDDTQTSGSQWRGHLPYYRLLLVFTDDEIRRAYLNRANVLSREQIDARKSDVRSPTAFELMAEKWNDPMWNPELAPSSSHSDFQTAIDCSWCKVEHYMPCTSVKASDFVSQMRKGLLRIIPQWERSGQGDGGIDMDGGDPDQIRSGDDYGKLTNRPARALANRENFLRGEPSYLLYFWEMADKYQLLNTTLQMLDSSISARSASHAPSALSSASGSKRRNKKKYLLKKRLGEANAVGAGLKSLADAMENTDRKRRVDELENQVTQFEEKEVLATDLRIQKFYRDKVNELKKRLMSLQETHTENPMPVSSIAFMDDCTIDDSSDDDEDVLKSVDDVR